MLIKLSSNITHMEEFSYELMLPTFAIFMFSFSFSYSALWNSKKSFTGIPLIVNVSP